tara:strand:- start:814 stop:1026 length:213 start_codon:yes stop_codon:yes gene_type:complete
MQLKLNIKDEQYTFLSFDDKNVDELKEIFKALTKKEDKVSAYILDHYDSNNDGQTHYKIYNWITERNKGV